MTVSARAVFSDDDDSDDGTVVPGAVHSESRFVDDIRLVHIALVFQLTDAPVYEWLGFVSGHTLKHLCAGVASWQIVRMLTSQKVWVTLERKV